MKILIAGGTGFIGQSLVEVLKKEGHEILLLTRSQRRDEPGLKFLEWNGVDVGPWFQAVNDVEAVINLAGSPIAAKRWTLKVKEEILQSRIDSIRNLIHGIEKSGARPKVWINASAVGYYGAVESGDVDEKHPKGTGFLPDVCELWEQEARGAEKIADRVIMLRTGIVLDRGGGALSKMLPPFRLFLGGPVGSGNQWFPWIHREDVIRAILFALNQNGISGPINLTAPEPVTMRNFCKSLGRAMNRPSWIPVPAFAIKFMLGEMSEMLLTGQKALPSSLLKEGFRFKYPTLDEALKAIFP